MGGGFIGRPRKPSRAGPGQRVRWRPCCAMAGLGLEPESGSRSGTKPIGGPRLSAREKGEERGAWWAGWAGGGENGADWARPCGRKGRRGERERESGPGPKRERGRKRIAFKCI
jgi:hypothetical protein